MSRGDLSSPTSLPPRPRPFAPSPSIILLSPCLQESLEGKEARAENFRLRLIHGKWADDNTFQGRIKRAEAEQKYHDRIAFHS